MKQKTILFLNELTATKARYKRVSEESVPAGYFSSREISNKFKMNHRVCQRKLSDYLASGKLDVVWARRRASLVAIRKCPCYKFKKKSYEKSFKG
jgi:hypothetical protein